MAFNWWIAAMASLLLPRRLKSFVFHCNIKCSWKTVLLTGALKFGALIAVWMFYNISELQVKFHSFYHSHQPYLEQNHHPSQLKPHLKHLSQCSPFASTWCRRKHTKIIWNPSLCAIIFTGSDGQNVRFSHFLLLEPDARVPLWKLLHVNIGYGCHAGSTASSATQQSRLLRRAESVNSYSPIDAFLIVTTITVIPYCRHDHSQSQQSVQPLTVDALAVVFVIDVPHKVVFLQQSVGRVLEAGEWLWCAAVALCRGAAGKACHNENFATPHRSQESEPVKW